MWTFFFYFFYANLILLAVFLFILTFHFIHHWFFLAIAILVWLYYFCRECYRLYFFLRRSLRCWALAGEIYFDYFIYMCVVAFFEYIGFLCAVWFTILDCGLLGEHKIMLRCEASVQVSTSYHIFCIFFWCLCFLFIFLL